MILPDFILPSRVNQQWQYSGMDSIEKCLDKTHFRSYPHKIDYKYNARGFRDTEWPNIMEELQKSIWCIGDSFTVGVGSPIEHTWPYILQKKTGIRTINVSMDGASNNWIARHAVQILDNIQPKNLIIHWSYLHRREGITFLNADSKRNFLIYYNNVKDPSWPSLSTVENFSLLPVEIQYELLTHHTPGDGVLSPEDLRLWHIQSEIDADVVNSIDCIKLVDHHQQDTCVIHSFIPRFGIEVENRLYKSTSNPVVEEFKILDFARDGHHYDINTSEYFVQQLMQILD